MILVAIPSFDGQLKGFAQEIRFSGMIRRQSGLMKMVLSLLLVTLFLPPVFGEDLKIYAAAAFRSPLVEIASQYEAATGHKVTLVFDTAGATEQGFRGDPEAVLLITTLTLINDAEKTGRLTDGATYRLGDSLAGIAFSPGSVKPDISTPEMLKAALLAAKRIAFSDPARGATVGIHFMRVIQSLGVKDEVLRKAAVARDGVETMRLVLEEKIDIGITQMSEILQASREALGSPFPKEYELATTYALWRRNTASQAAMAFVTLLTSPASRAKLAQNGIRPAVDR
jgi:molybdate transport system substrate-binding protein